MNLLHTEYLEEIINSNPSVWDDKYSDILIPFGSFDLIIFDIIKKIFEMYNENTDPNIDQRFYYFIRYRYATIKTLIDSATQLIDKKNVKASLSILRLRCYLNSFCTVDYLREQYANDKLNRVIYINDKITPIDAESFEQYVVFLRSATMCSVEDCLDYIPLINLDNEEFSPTYNRILPFIKTKLSGLQTKSARN